MLGFRFFLGCEDEVSSAVVTVVTGVRVRLTECEDDIVVEVLLGSIEADADPYWNLDSCPLKDGVGGSGVLESESLSL